MSFSHLSSYTKRLTDKVYRGRLLSSHSLSASNKDGTTSTTGTMSTDDMTNSGLSSDRDEILSMDSSSGHADGGGGEEWRGGAFDGRVNDVVPSPSATSNASHTESLLDSSPQMIQKDIQFIPEDGDEEFPTGEMSFAHNRSVVTMDESTRSTSTSISSGASTTSGTSASSTSTSSSDTTSSSSSSSSRDSSGRGSSSSDENDPMLGVTSDVMDVIGGLALDGSSFDAVVVANEEEGDVDVEDGSPTNGSPQTSIMSRIVLPTIPNLVEDDSGDFVLDATSKKAHVEPPFTATTNHREGDNHDDDDYATRRNRRLEALQAGRMERKKLLEENSLSKKMGSPTFLCMEDHPYALAQHERKLQELEQRRNLYLVANSGGHTTQATSQYEMAPSHGMDEKVLDELVSAHHVIHHQRLYTQYLELQVRKVGVDELPIPVRLDESNAERNETKLVKSLQAELVKQQQDHAEEILTLRNRITSDAWNFELRIQELERQLKASKV